MSSEALWHDSDYTEIVSILGRGLGFSFCQVRGLLTFFFVCEGWGGREVPLQHVEVPRPGIELAPQ